MIVRDSAFECSGSLVDRKRIMFRVVSCDLVDHPFCYDMNTIHEITRNDTKHKLLFAREESKLLIKPELWCRNCPAVFQRTNERGRGRLKGAVANFPFSDPAFHRVHRITLALTIGPVTLVGREAICGGAFAALYDSDS